MIRWQDEGVILSARRHGETSMIVEAFTASHGRHAGVVRGGASRKMAATLQPGTGVALDWTARVEDHIGSYTIEPVRSRAHLIADRDALAALTAVAGLSVFALPEREPHNRLYAHTIALFDALGQPGWEGAYALWELALLAELGFGLDLSACAATGRHSNLTHVSPKSGCAVCREAAEPWLDRLLPLPGFWLDGDARPDIPASLHTTGHFLAARLAAPTGRPLPPARARLVDRLSRAANVPERASKEH